MYNSKLLIYRFCVLEDVAYNSANISVACNSKMTQPSNFITKVFRKDKTIKISTVSPNGKFFYKIKDPKDLYWGLFCSPIAFFDKEKNLIYYNKAQYAQFGLTKAKEWEVVSWSLSGNFAFFIERNDSKSFQYILLDLANKTVSKTNFQNTGKDKWIAELFSRLPQDKAQEAYYRISSALSSNEVFDYVLTLNLIDDKRELIKSLDQYYYSDFKKRLLQFEEGSFDDAVISNSEFDNFTSIVPDKLQNGILESLAFDNWRP
jgi:hypothetical protein